jgi:hypothetical protein
MSGDRKDEFESGAFEFAAGASAGTSGASAEASGGQKIFILNNNKKCAFPYYSRELLRQ